MTNSVKSFFNDRVLSFDTETTGLNFSDLDKSKQSQIWQLGLASDDGIGIERNTNPFFVFDKSKNIAYNPSLTTKEFKDSLINSNGQFSKDAYKRGNFKGIINQYDKNPNSLPSLFKSLEDTLGKIKSRDIVVLQNMNFENRALQSAHKNGLIPDKLYSSIQDKMETVSLDENLKPKDIFQRPSSVQALTREAEYLYYTQYLPTRDKEIFSKYTKTLNSGLDKYKDVINDSNRKGAVAVELMDISKAFYANAAEKGYIDRSTALLGTNIDFLANTILGVPEDHTALKDSKQTIDLFKRLWTMTDQLRNNTVDNETLQMLDSIKQAQPKELNQNFANSVKSVLSDFKLKGETTIRGSLSWYQPRVALRSLTEDRKNILESKSLNSQIKTKNLEVAMESIREKYSHFEDNVMDFNRDSYINTIIKDYNNGMDVDTLHDKVEKTYISLKDSKEQATKPLRLKPVESKFGSKAYWNESVQLLGKDMKRSSKFGLVGATVAGLGIMGMSTTPPPEIKNDESVSSQFYDDQYLGTAFVNFKERNKHYMY